MSGPTQLVFIKTEEDEKDILKRRIKELEDENETLKQALEQLQQLQGKCCDWCELLMPSCEQDQSTISHWLEGVLTVFKSQKAESQLIIDDEDNLQLPAQTTLQTPTSPPIPPPPPVAPSQPPSQPIQQQQQQQQQIPAQSSISLPNFTVNQINTQPIESVLIKKLNIDYLKLKDIIRFAEDRRGDKMKYLLNKLIDATFTRDELVGATGLGIRTHKDKHHTPLDRKKLVAIKDFLEQFAKKNGIQTMDPRTFRVTVGNKITNARRNLRNEFK